MESRIFAGRDDPLDPGFSQAPGSSIEELGQSRAQKSRPGILHHRNVWPPKVGDHTTQGSHPEGLEPFFPSPYSEQRGAPTTNSPPHP